VKGWQRCLPSLLQGDRWWRCPVVIRPMRGAKQNHRSPAALTSPKGELRTRLNGAATMGAEAWFDGGEKFAEGHRAVPFYMSKSHISWIIV
jgi:hypothetical protein